MISFFLDGKNVSYVAPVTSFTFTSELPTEIQMWGKLTFLGATILPFVVYKSTASHTRKMIHWEEQ